MAATVRPNRLVRDLRVLSDRITEVAGPPRAGGNGWRRRAWLELVRVLNGAGEFEEIPWYVPNTIGLTARITEAMHDARNHALARAVYESSAYAGNIDAYITRGELHRSEWEFFSKLIRDLNVAPAYGHDQLVGEPPAWMIDVDEAHHEARVWIRELALQDMLLAGMEAYLVPAGSGKPSTEIYGIAFGSMRMAPPAHGDGISLVDYNVERVCIQHRAKCGPSEVFADERSERTQLAMGEELFPYWQLLGDFHTHTYRSLAELRQQGGWNYSQADQDVNIDWCRKLRTIGHRPRVALILAITRAGRRGPASVEGWNGLPNVVRTTIGRCHCFISAYRIRRDGVYTTDGLMLKCPPLAGHIAPMPRPQRVLSLAHAGESRRRRYARA